jgi:hypothetical protein
MRIAITCLVSLLPPTVKTRDNLFIFRMKQAEMKIMIFKLMLTSNILIISTFSICPQINKVFW